jgi:hypothetical protein
MLFRLFFQNHHILSHRRITRLTAQAVNQRT